MTNPWINKYQNWNTFYSPNISHSLKIQKIFCCMRCDTRTRVFNFWNLRCRKRSKKGPLSALTFESSKNFILTDFQKLMWFYLLATKDNFLGFFPMRNTLDRSYRDRLLNAKNTNMSISFIRRSLKLGWLISCNNFSYESLKSLKTKRWMDSLSFSIISALRLPQWNQTVEQ